VINGGRVAVAPQLCGRHDLGYGAIRSESSLPEANRQGARMSRSCRQSDFLRHAEALERWADGRERAIAVLERRADRFARQGSPEEAGRLRAAARHLRRMAFADRALALELRRAITLTA
jgi:hypothetical protein